MSIGLEGAFGTAGAQDSLDKILAQRMLARKIEEAQKQQEFENLMQMRTASQNDQRIAQTDQQRKDTLAETTRQHNLQDQEKQVGLANALGDQIPQGTFLPPTDPAVGMLRTGGRSSLLQPQDERPRVDVGPLQPGDTGAARQQGFIKRASFAQADKTADNERQAKASDAAIAAKIEGLHQAAEHLRMQGEVNAANILRAQAEAEAAHARAGATAAKGNTINLSAGGKSAKAAIEQAGPLTDQVMQMILKEAPDIETNPQKYNGVLAKGTSMLQTAKYKLGFHDETDPRQQLVSLLQPIQAGQYTRSSRSRQMLDLALKHMADPSQTLLTQYQRAKELKAIMPEMLQGLVRAEQPVDLSNPLGGSYFDPSKSQGGGGQEFDYVPGKGLVPKAK